tara:strand:- start:2724 stop:2981 length:258 start_codon:yes stop_codon:yes gene_type:complete
MTIKVYYCFPDDNYKINSINIETDTNIGDFIHDILGLDKETAVGVYGKLKDVSYIIKENDRIEIYEKILADPKIKRKKRASNEKC